MTDKETKIKGLETDLANEKKQRTSLANDLAQLRETYDRLEERLQEAKLKADSLKDQITYYGGKSKRGVELKKIVIKPKRDLVGKVLVVNREFQFVVVDLGKKDGIRVGDEFRIYQDSEGIAKVQVEKVYETMATATILVGSDLDAIAEDNILKPF